MKEFKGTRREFSELFVAFCGSVHRKLKFFDFYQHNYSNQASGSSLMPPQTHHKQTFLGGAIYQNLIKKFCLLIISCSLVSFFGARNKIFKS
jgi:hypothetical protein